MLCDSFVVLFDFICVVLLLLLGWYVNWIFDYLLVEYCFTCCGLSGRFVAG